MGGDSDVDNPKASQREYDHWFSATDSRRCDPWMPCKAVIFFVGFLLSTLLVAFLVRCIWTYYSLPLEDRYMSKVLLDTWFNSDPDFFIYSFFVSIAVFVLAYFCGACLSQLGSQLMRDAVRWSSHGTYDCCGSTCSTVGRTGRRVGRKVVGTGAKLAIDVTKQSAIVDVSIV